MLPKYRTTFRCASGHILGLVQDRGQGKYLAILRHAVDTLSDQAEIIGTVYGVAMEIECDLCGRTRTWYPQPERINALSISEIAV